jgi:hypothetical protein
MNRLKVMKQWLEVIALYLFGLNALEIVLAVSGMILLLKMLADKMLFARKTKKCRETENMWSIE